LKIIQDVMNKLNTKQIPMMKSGSALANFLLAGQMALFSMISKPPKDQCVIILV